MPTIPLDALLVATGFTGALTLVWLVRLICGAGRAAAEVTLGTAEQRAATLSAVIAAARREVLLRTDRLAARPVAQALIAAKQRGVGVEVMLSAASAQDAGSDLPFLVEQGLPPLLEDGEALRDRLIMVVDRAAVVLGSLSAAGDLLLLRDHAGAAASYRADFAARKARARALPVNAEMPAEVPPSNPPAPDVLTAVAQGMVTAPEEEPSTKAAPLVTPAAAEMFARLRKELAEAGEEPSTTKKAG